MRTYTQPQLLNPRMAQRRPGSVFTPAIAAWSNPGALGSYLSGISGIPTWAGYVGAGAFLGLAALKKIPWWAGLAGAAAAYFTLGTANAPLIYLPPNNATIPLNSVSLAPADSGGNQAFSYNGISYVLLPGADGYGNFQAITAG